MTTNTHSLIEIATDDGLLSVMAYRFNFAGRTWAAHRVHESCGDPSLWTVSDVETGFGFRFTGKTRAEAERKLELTVRHMPEGELDGFIAAAKAKRPTIRCQE